MDVWGLIGDSFFDSCVIAEWNRYRVSGVTVCLLLLASQACVEYL